MIVKICGLTTLEDALAAIEAGADMLGFNFYSASPRHIFPKECARLTAALQGYRPAVMLVGVFVDASPEQITRTISECGLDLAQLSGDEPPETLQRLGQRAYKALRPADPQNLLALVQKYPPRSTPPAYLIDAYRLGQYGGTGQSANWSLAASLSIRSPLFLAGGLTAENVITAIRQVRPWGVDVASGVETSPGRKNSEKMRAFIQAAKGDF
jgi:phosphoribosylanthranilate isomerase